MSRPFAIHSVCVANYESPRLQVRLWWCATGYLVCALSSAGIPTITAVAQLERAADIYLRFVELDAAAVSS